MESIKRVCPLGSIHLLSKMHDNLPKIMIMSCVQRWHFILIIGTAGMLREYPTHGNPVSKKVGVQVTNVEQMINVIWRLTIDPIKLDQVCSSLSHLVLTITTSHSL